MRLIYNARPNDWGLLAAFIWAMLCYVCASGGKLGMTLDSRYYLAAAESWAASRTLTDFSGNVYANWPPLYPWLLSLGAPDILSFAFGLHAVALLAGIFFFSRCLPDDTPPQIHIPAVLSWALYAPLLACGIHLWSEAVFMALLLAAFIAFCRKDKQTLFRYLYPIAANLMCMQRHAGIFFVAAWTLGDLFSAPTDRRKVLTTLAEGAICSAAFAAWQARNFFLAENIHDFRQNMALVSLAESVQFSLSAMSTWLLPLPIPLPVRLTVFLATAAGLIFLGFREKGRQRIFLALSLSFACYLFGTWSLRMNIASENDRYFLPLFPFFLLLIVNVLRARAKIVIPLLAWICIYQTARGLSNTHRWYRARAAVEASVFDKRIIGLDVHVGKYLRGVRER